LNAGSTQTITIASKRKKIRGNSGKEKGGEPSFIPLGTSFGNSSIKGSAEGKYCWKEEQMKQEVTASEGNAINQRKRVQERGVTKKVCCGKGETWVLWGEEQKGGAPGRRGSRCQRPGGDEEEGVNHFL